MRRLGISLYLFLAGCFGLAWPPFESIRSESSSRAIGRDFEFRRFSMLEVEGIELFADAFEDDSPLQSLLIPLSSVLSCLPPLLFRLLRADDTLISQRRLEALELRSGHDQFFLSGGRPNVR